MARDRYVSRKAAKRLITDDYFDVAERTLLEWRDVPLVYLNGKAHAKEADWRRAAERRLREQLARQGAAEVAVLRSAARAQAARIARRRLRHTSMPERVAATV